MTGRNAFLLGAALVVASSELVLWRALHDATEGLQHMARTYADHRCSAGSYLLRPPEVERELYEYVPGRRLVQPAPMADPALAHSAHSLGRS